MLQDLRFAVRMLSKKPGFSVVAVLALALAIGGTTSVFSVFDAILLRPLPYRDAGDILVLGESTWKDRTDLGSVSPANFLDWKAQNHVFAEIATYREWQWNLASGDRPERATGAVSSGEFFRLLGVGPLLGRTLDAQDSQPGHDLVAVIGYRLWSRRFAGDEHVLGRSLTLDGRQYMVVGVMPREFNLPEGADLWIPSPWNVPPHPLHPSDDPRPLRDSHYLDVLARPRPGMSAGQVQADLDLVARRIAAANPDTNRDSAIGVQSLRESLAGGLRPTLLLLATAVGFVLLIACANVANLLLVRATERTSEISVRMALGATRAHILRLVVAESLALAFAGGAAGVLLATWATPALLALGPASVRDTVDGSLDLRIVVFTCAVSALTGVLFGLLPALQASRTSINESLQQAGREGQMSRRAGRTRAGLVAAEMALSLVLLVGAGLLLLSFSRLMQVNPGFSADRVLVFTLAPSSVDPQRDVRLYQRVIEQLQAVPGVQSAAAVSRLPLGGGNSTRSFGVVGSDAVYDGDIRIATPGYFQALDIPLRAGRSFTWADDASAAPVVIINETLARRVFRTQDPIGRILDQDKPRRIVGVIGDVRHVGLDVAPRPEFYLPASQYWWPMMTATVRSATTEPSSLIPVVQQAVWSVDKGIALGDPRTMRDVLGRSVARREFAVVLLSIFAAIAVALTAIGLYGVMVYSVSRRTREIGIRIALGAGRSTIVSMILGQSLAVTGVGAVVGLAAAFALTRVMATLLFGVSPRDPLIFTLVPLLLVAVALVASYVPARRATRINPIAALRHE